MYGLIGKKLTYSYSAKVFEKYFGKSIEFKLIELESIQQLPEYLINNHQLYGFSVTIPFKKSIIPYISVLDNISKEIETVNTVHLKKIKDKVELYGYNTDVYGFTQAYQQYFPVDCKNAIILGTGGASAAVNYALQKIGIKTIKVSRTKNENGIITFSELTDKIISQNKIIINATPLGMYPNVENYPPIIYNALNSEHVIIDLNYNPEETTFMKMAKIQNAKIYNGYQMLEYQAKKAWQIWGLV